MLFYPLCVWLQLSFRHPSHCISCDVSLSVSTLSSPVSLFYLVPCFTLSLTFHCNWHFCNVLLSNNSLMLSTDILLFIVPLRSHFFLQGLFMTCTEMRWVLLFVCNNFITTFPNDFISWILPHFHLEPDAIRCCWAQGSCSSQIALSRLRCTFVMSNPYFIMLPLIWVKKKIKTLTLLFFK